MTCAVCHLSDAAANTRASTMELDRLYQPPAILSVNRHPEYNVDGCRAIIFEGERFQDQPVSLFAYYAAPAGMAPAQGWPGVVLVHGGGGTALANYVKDWNGKGYAAIALDWYGLFPEVEKKLEERRKVEPNTVVPMYSYQDAVSNIIRCHSLLRSFPEVNAEKTGIVGASWGGFFALTVAGYDQRFKCVISAYAAGFWQNTPFDPKNHVMNITVPVLRTAVVNELNFPLPRWQETVDLTTHAESTLSIDLAMGHSNIGLAWPINYHFADMVLKQQGVLPKIGPVRLTGDTFEADVTNLAQLDQARLGKVELHYTTAAPAAREGRFYEKEQWQCLPAERVDGVLRATVPAGTRACFVNLFWNGLPISTRFLMPPVHTHDPNVAEEFRPRDGLPNVFAKIEAGATVRVAYLGGSITAANGWRVKTMEWFRTQFPKATVDEIDAAISGTGSDFSACRLETDVLAKDPDLIFLECRVNGHAGFPVQSVEGIVRHTWQARPNTDLCFVYTICTGMVEALQAGRTPEFGAVMERVANVYGIPTIDMGVEVARQEADGRLVHTSDAPVPGKAVFSADGTHPGDVGHDIYRDVVARSFLKMTVPAGRRVHVLPPERLHDRCWDTATLLPVRNTVLSSGWAPVDADRDPVYNDSSARTKAMLRGAVKCSTVGETITVRWCGTTIGFSDIPHGGPMVVDVSVDGAAPVRCERVQTETVHQYSRFFYLPELPAGDHTAVLTVRQLPENTAFYAGQVLVVGRVLGPSAP
ncbi:MAG: hypothetical protein A3K19_26205 [Lentisphaerae bacterium RIFOXYB12_FULL_65_16]|nr:MAG: hypothetical protein A3K18_29670 [Lentisphaerae bacterium RIFOXYA12_64_32]OGV87768.1 MAG: hypothetical protein A3K19_26205 [Lentisphaerae bacterium RIFOXYB12_FULL_65_16]